MTAHKVEDHFELNEEDARSGQTGVHLRYILLASLLLVLAGFGIVAVLS